MTTTTTWKRTPIQGLPAGGREIADWRAEDPVGALKILGAASAALTDLGNSSGFTGRVYEEGGGVVWFACFARDDAQIQYVVTPSRAEA